MEIEGGVMPGTSRVLSMRYNDDGTDFFATPSRDYRSSAQGAVGVRLPILLVGFGAGVALVLLVSLVVLFLRWRGSEAEKIEMARVSSPSGVSFVVFQYQRGGVLGGSSTWGFGLGPDGCSVGALSHEYADYRLVPRHPFAQWVAPDTFRLLVSRNFDIPPNAPKSLGGYRIEYDRKK